MQRANLSSDRMPVDAGIEGKVLGATDGECLGERVEGFGWSGFGSVLFFSRFAADEVDAVLTAPA